MNPILQRMNQPVIPEGAIKQLMNIVQSSNNPISAIQAMMASNPIYKELFPMIQKNHGDYKRTFYDLAEKRGINAEQFLKDTNISKYFQGR